MFETLFKRGTAVTAGRELYAACAAAARRPAFYLALQVPDTVEGRFELYALHTLLVVLRLRGVEPSGKDVSQALFDALLLGLDDGLRDMGVGDLSVGKKMRKLGAALYGRAKNLDLALAAADPAELEAFVVRTVYAGDESLEAGRLARWVRAAHAALAGESDQDLLAGVVRFAEVTE